MAYSKSIANAIISVFEEHEYHYNFDNEDGVLSANFNSDNKLGSVHLKFLVRETDYIAASCIDIHADKNSLADVAELLMRMNFGLIFGNYELDFRDGEIRFRYGVDCEGSLPSKDIIINSLLFVLKAFSDERGNALVSVLFGLMTPVQAIEHLSKS